MSKMRVTISPLDKDNRTAKGLVSTLILLSKERGVNCQLASPTEATIEGDEYTLLEILDRIDTGRSIQEKIGIAIATEFEKSRNKLFPQRESEFTESKTAGQTCSQELLEETKKDKERLHNMVLERLARRIERWANNKF
jgi:uncharacterized protein YqgV (UPF0045/DUF77 family)